MDSILPDQGPAPVIEWLILRCKPGISIHDPRLLETLREVRDKLGTNSRFYKVVDKTDTILLLGEWPSVQAHQDFLDSPNRDAVLAKQEELTTFIESGHVKGSLPNLPREAKLLSFSHYPVQNTQEKVLFGSSLASCLAQLDREATGWSSGDTVASKIGRVEVYEDETVWFIGWWRLLGLHRFYAELKKIKVFSDHAAFETFWENMLVCQDLETL